AASQPTAGQTLQVTTAGAAFASVLPGSGEQYTLRLSPGGNSAGEYAVNLIAVAGNGARYQTTVYLRVRRPESNIPTSNDQSLIASAGVARNLTLTGSDPLNRALLMRLISAPSGGTITGDLPNVTYTPRSGFTGLDSFTYRAIINGTAIASEASVVYVIVR
ncbi:MAG TPA: Ig-like domain-containing protein, partial [Blastocatellia bacterium]|nr:Ig-like domain-containing protein [Blastocatellia bacterium]